MTTLVAKRTRESPEVGGPEGRTRNRGTVVVLVLALLVTGAWIIYHEFVRSRSAVTAEVGAVVDGYLDAWNAYDAGAFLDLVTDDFSIGEIGEPVAAARDAASAVRGARSVDWHAEIVGERIMSGHGPWTVSAVVQITRSTEPPEDVMSVFTIVEDGGVLLVRSHVYLFTEDSYTPAGSSA